MWRDFARYDKTLHNTIMTKIKKKNRVTPRRPSGFPEYSPAEQLEFNRLLGVIRASYESAGFTPIETPALELSEVLLAKGGGDTEKEVFRFGKGSKDYVMHYDLTVPLARYVAEHQNNLVFPFRRSQIQKVWRAERAQKGRAREFYQCDADVVGETDVAVDGELIALAAQTIRLLDIGKFVIKVNNRKLLTGMYEALGLQDKNVEILRLIDKLEKIGSEEVVNGLMKLGLTPESAEQLLELMHLSGPVDQVLTVLHEKQITNATFVRGIEELERALDAARAAGAKDAELEIDCSKARGLDYYTATVFETVLTDMPELGSVCSGGRFDDLASYYTDRSLPGVGISIGLTRLFDGLLFAKKVDISRQTTSQVIVYALDEAAWESAGDIAQELRQHGCVAELVLTESKPAKVFSRADKLGVAVVCILGEKELAAHTVAVKNLRTGEQSEIARTELVQFVRHLV